MSDFDIIVIGSGPAGQKAAVQASKAGKRVALIERDALLGGACVHRGTIPSKTLRENALRVNNMRKNAALFQFKLSEDLEMATLIDRLDDVMKSHDEYMRRQIDRNTIKRVHGRARFLSPNEVEVTSVRGEKQVLATDYVVIATGSFPRKPDQVPIDHENIFDSDSVLSMLYLPKSLAVLGGGVIASEYASIFQALGVRVIMIDRYPRPLGFLDKDLTDNFVNAFQDMGGVWMGDSVVKRVYFDGVNDVITELEDGRTIITQKLLCAAGRVANVKDLDIDNAGLELDERGVIPVDGQLRTRVPNIFAAGDVIGPPSLASASMEQGRRAACNAIGLKVGSMPEMIPVGIYGVPELSSVGMSEQEARKAYGQIIVGRAPFAEIARGHISGNQDGMLKLVCDAEGRRLLGVQIVGEEATELIHIGQMALLSKSDVDIFVESIFNFPTLAEAYRVAALAVIGQRARRNSVY
ncbi:Si-specific NAD(P)(+) transhydrogenase [Hahella aquimaris]|uniref:Si-specific NAD(P)(+) transhydrogenase n=1 Tax=Hahella sp. HNIBRBA332 TaxID=3015983 RepID=UPI00273BF77C|nr:Si-specific NAD(P)(+) transhydrogenase [Hahella sp. HNIBRBA332]WLQ11288.1 Si-specific NAD(P)(+) transhydrogenase [Hahella sp. HNIBRBA332]